MNLGGWAISDPDERGELHCVPVNDLKGHSGEDCDCHPKRDEEAPNLWLHNSFDGREKYETGEMKLS